MRRLAATALALCAALLLSAGGAGEVRAQMLPGQGSGNIAQQFRTILNQSNHLRGQHQGQELGEPVTQTYDMFFFPGGEVLRIVRIRPQGGEGETKRKSEWGTYSVDQFDQKISFYFPDSGRRSFPIRVMPSRQSVLIGRMALQTVSDRGLVGRGLNTENGYRIRSLSGSGDSGRAVSERFGDFRRDYRASENGILIATIPEPGRYVLLDRGPRQSGEGNSGEEDGSGEPSGGEESSASSGDRTASVGVLEIFSVGGRDDLNWQMLDRRYDDDTSFNYHPKAAQERN